MAKSTTKFQTDAELTAFRETLKYNYLKKFKVLFLSVFEFKGFDYGEDYYILDKIFNGENIAVFKLKTAVGEESPCAFQSYSPEGYDMYNNPVRVRILNLRSDPRIPSQYLSNNVDVVLFRPQINYSSQLQPLIELLVDADMTIRTNLKLHKMPFMIDGSDQMKKTINDVLSDKALVALDETMTIRSASTNTPYIIDKLEQFKIAIESRILSLIGIKGQKMEKMAQMTVDEVNNNSEEINGFKNHLVDSITKWLSKANELFGTSYEVVLNDDYLEMKDEEPQNGIPLQE